MIDRFQGVHSPNLAAAVLRQDFVQNKNEIAEALIAAGTLLEFQPGENLIVQNEETSDIFLLAAGNIQISAHGVEIGAFNAHRPGVGRLQASQNVQQR